MSETPQTSTVATPPRSRAASYTDMVAELLWPKLLRAVPLAWRPERLILAFAILFLTLCIGQFGALGTFTSSYDVAAGEQDRGNFSMFIARRVAGGVGGIATGIYSLDIDQIREEAKALVLRTPTRVWDRYRTISIVLGFPILLVWAVGGCALARMIACDVARGVVIDIQSAIGFAVKKLASVLGALLIPLAVIGVLVGTIMVMGWIVFSLIGATSLGAIVYGIFMLIAFFACLLGFLYVAGAPMLIPAIACEGTDWMEAVQRSFAYALGQPLRLVMYLVLSLLVAWPILLVLDALSDATSAVALWSVGAINHNAVQSIVIGDPGQVPTFAAKVVRFWSYVPEAIVWSFATSYLFASTTILYLLLRQAHDNQDHSEIWMPGLIEGTMAESLRARAQLAATHVAETPDKLLVQPRDDS